MPQAIRLFNEEDRYFFSEGTHVRLADVLGAHYSAEEGGTRFAVWAPRAQSVSVIGAFNGWRRKTSWLSQGPGGVWQGFLAGVSEGERYRYFVEALDGTGSEKIDPVGFLHDLPPANASVVRGLEYDWQDDEWMRSRARANSLEAPMSTYEVHLGSWKRFARGGLLSYRELADSLVPYVREMGYTHVEFMPVMEHPFYGSWGYQTTGYFAPTSRYGTPQDFMALVERFHQAGIGVILDWVPSHFPQDEHALARFDGEPEYEPVDPRQALQPEWNSFTFSYARGEVRSFLLCSARFWLSRYHIDGLRVDAVASMLYLDYARPPGQWTPNEYGGRENLNAEGFLRRLNEDVYRHEPAVQTMAEESTAWPQVSRPTHVGGLGFGLKWDMGWMHDTLAYMAQDPINRRYRHGELTFRSVYAFSENFVLPLSHDEVVYGKRSLLAKMPGDELMQFANLRLLYAYMFAQPGKKLLFMGGEFGQRNEWNHDTALDWDLLQVQNHASVRLLIGDLNHLYRTHHALNHCETSPDSFEWIEANDSERNTLCFLRKGGSVLDQMLVVCNFSGAFTRNYQVGAPVTGRWREILNTDSKFYGGKGRGNFGALSTVPVPAHGHSRSLFLDLPPLSALYFEPAKE